VIQMVTAQHVLTFPAEEGGPTLNNLNVNALSKSLMTNVMDHQLIGDMGLRYGVGEVMRWKPAFVLSSSSSFEYLLWAIESVTDCRMLIWVDQGYGVLQENVCFPLLGQSPCRKVLLTAEHL